LIVDFSLWMVLICASSDSQIAPNAAIHFTAWRADRPVIVVCGL